MSQAIVKPGPGGTCTEESNQGEPFKFTTPPADCSQLMSLTEIIAIPLRRDEHTKRPTCLRGELMLSLTMNLDFGGSSPPILNVWQLGIEVEVDAYNGSEATRIGRRILSIPEPSWILRFGETDTWDRLSVLAAASVNGAFAPLTAASNMPGLVAAVANLQSSVLMWR